MRDLCGARLCRGEKDYELTLKALGWMSSEGKIIKDAVFSV